MMDSLVDICADIGEANKSERALEHEIQAEEFSDDYKAKDKKAKTDYKEISTFMSYNYATQHLKT